MRAVIPFETEAESSRIDEILARHDWMIDSTPVEAQDRREFWLQKISKVSPQVTLIAQEAALVAQLTAERELLSDSMPDTSDIIDKQLNAISAQETAIIAERIFLDRLGEPAAGNGNGNGNGQATRPDGTLISFAAKEAREILRHISPDDHEIAVITFQYPIYDRTTQTFGTVHYEPSKHHAIIRLKNSQSEKLKAATKRIVEHLVLGSAETDRSARLLYLGKTLSGKFRRLWYRSAHRHRRPIAFARIKVLEPGKSNEAFSGKVIPERSFGSVLRERLSDIIVACVFLTLGLTVSFLSSPLVFNFDYTTHAEKWSDGWLAWVSGNLSRVGSAFFVGVFLPIIQVLLYWRAVRREPIVSWNIDVAEL